MRTLLEEVIVKVERDKATARLTLRWKGGALAEIDLALPCSRRRTSIPAVCGQRAKPSCGQELRTMRSWRPEIVAIQICVGSSAA